MLTEGGNLSTNITTGNAIEIQTNNVTIDLNGYKLGGLSGGPSTQASGIYALGRKNITIRNGIVRGFRVGIVFNDIGSGVSQGHLIEDIRADQNRAYGLSISGAGTIIRRNQIVSTGGGGTQAYGIATTGNDLRILDNDVTDTHADDSWGKGISHSGGLGCIIKHNRISGVSSVASPVSTAGIDISSAGTAAMVIDNEIADAGETCLRVDEATVIFRNNTVSGCNSDYFGGTDGGGNFPVPSP